MKHLAIAAALALAACQPEPAKPATEAKPAAEAAKPEASAPSPTPAKPSGTPRQIKAEPKDMPEAWVTDVHMIKGADAKIFSTAGGDPAVNGLYTYLAIYEDPDGWTKVFQIGDFNSWKVVEESASRVVLEVSRSWVDQPSGDIKTATEKLIVDIPAAGAATLSVTPAA